MFPIRDSVPKERTPVVVYSLILVNTLVFLYQTGLSRGSAEFFAYSYGFVPYVFFYPDASLRPDVTAANLWPLITAAFLHADWWHILFNMWTLFIFGSSLEGRLGNAQFLLFYLCCAAAASYAHGYFNPRSTAPVIGASGAIAGVIGAYALSFPTARITLLLPIIIIPFIFTIPALAYAAIFFGIQLWQSVASGLDGDSIAWWAHIGGFLTGLALLPFFMVFAPPRRTSSGYHRGPWD